MRAILRALFALALAGQSANGGDLKLEVAGPARVVFRASTEACDGEDYPDAPARAYRDASGTMHLFATHYVNRAMVGRSLDDLKHDCRVVFRGKDNPDPAASDDKGWLASFYTVEGRTVHALVHNEYQGHLRPERCPSRTYASCWYNTITYAVSRDGGLNFTHPQGRIIVAAAPMPYIPDAGFRIGASSPTNIVKAGEWFYFLYISDTPAAPGRVCVARAARLDDPRSWRAWGGQDFDVEMKDPFGRAESVAKACEPLTGLLSGSVGSVTLHVPTNTFVLTQEATAGKDRPSGIFYSTSPDLISWSRPQLLFEGPTYRPACGSSVTFGYPSLIDLKSRSRNFETMHESASLFLSMNHVENCRIASNRDLIAIPIRAAN